jgi:hypothetical protein
LTSEMILAAKGVDADVPEMDEKAWFQAKAN